MKDVVNFVILSNILLLVGFGLLNIKTISNELKRSIKKEEKTLIWICLALVLLLASYINIYVPGPMMPVSEGNPHKIQAICLSQMDKSENKICGFANFGALNDVGYPVLLMPFFSVFGLTDNVPVVLNTLFLIFSTLIVFAMMQYLTGRVSCASISAILFIFLPFRNYILGDNTVQCLFTFMILLFTFLFVLATRRGGFRLYAASLLALSYTLIVRAEFIVAVPVYLVWLLTSEGATIRLKSRIKDWFLAFLLALPFFVFFFAFNLQNNGNRMYFANLSTALFVPFLVSLMLLTAIRGGGLRESIKSFGWVYALLIFGFIIGLFLLKGVFMQSYSYHNTLTVGRAIGNLPNYINPWIDKYSGLGVVSYILLSLVPIIGVAGIIIGIIRRSLLSEVYLFAFIACTLEYMYIVTDSHYSPRLSFPTITFLAMVIGVGISNMWREYLRVREVDPKQSRYWHIIPVAVALCIMVLFQPVKIEPSRTFSDFFENRICVGDCLSKSGRNIEYLKDAAGRIDKESWIVMPGLESSNNLLFYTDNQFIDAEFDYINKGSFNITNTIRSYLSKNETVVLFKRHTWDLEINYPNVTREVEANFRLEYLFNNSVLTAYMVVGETEGKQQLQET